ncbi:hypothetical protein E2I00_002132, partial [Balaenoptera physalus]
IGRESWPRLQGAKSPENRRRPSSSGSGGLGYDPYNPELPKPPAQRENGALGRGAEPRSDILELELVNQAIEAVRSEVELEQRRYRELLETAREHGSAEAPALAPHGPTAGLDGDAFPLSFEYNPGGRGLEGPEPEEGSLRETKEMAVQYDVGDLGQPAKGPGGLPPAKPSSPGRASQERSSPKEGRPKKKKSGGPPAAGRKDGVGKTGRGQGGEHGRPAEKPCVDRRGPQAGNPRHRAERPQGTKKKPSSATPVARSGKGRPEWPGPRPSPTQGAAHQLPDRTGRKTPSGKLAERKARSLDEGGEGRGTGALGADHSVSWAEEEDLPPLQARQGGYQQTQKTSWFPPGPLHAQKESWFLPGSLHTQEEESWFPPGPLHTQEEESWFPLGPLHTQEEESWFPPGPLHTQEKASQVACFIPALEHLPPVPQYYPSTDTLGGLLWVPLTCSLDLKFVTQAEPMSRGPAPPTRPPTAQEVCYRRAQQAQRESASRLQAAQPLAEKQSSMHISAPGEKRRIAHVPNPLLAAGPLSRTRACRKAGLPFSSLVRGVLSGVSGAEDSPQARPRPFRLCPEMHVLLTLNGRSCLVLCSSVMGVLSSCTHVPCSPPAPTGAKRTLSASSSQPPSGPEPGSQPLKTRTLSGMASKTTATVAPKRVAHSPSLQPYCFEQFQFADPERGKGTGKPLLRAGKPAFVVPCGRLGPRASRRSADHVSLAVAGGWETQYTCCSAAIGSTGCQVAKQHVQDGRKENLEGFVKTFEKELSGDAHPGVYALDCEMSYTTFSGVTEADLTDTSISLRDVQAVLLSMFNLCPLETAADSTGEAGALLPGTPSGPCSCPGQRDHLPPLLLLLL